ncbi:MAG: C39 family peptidase [Caldilineaceae bacterium]|nr:C39 family peptidase [Caldilineaceae bacterium]
MLTPLLPVLHRPQSQQADCLAAFAAMILDYLQVPFNDARLRKLLRIRHYGAFFSDIENLTVLGVAVSVDEGDIDTLQRELDVGLPVIAAVNTGFLQAYWNEALGHAVVVVGIEDEIVYINDPALATAPQAIDLNEFFAAWGEKDFLYAVISLE